MNSRREDAIHPLECSREIAREPSGELRVLLEGAWNERPLVHGVKHARGSWTRKLLVSHRAERPRGVVASDEDSILPLRHRVAFLRALDGRAIEREKNPVCVALVESTRDGHAARHERHVEDAEGSQASKAGTLS